MQKASIKIYKRRVLEIMYKKKYNNWRKSLGINL